MIAFRIRAGSRTRLSLSASGLYVPDSASVRGSVTAGPWARRSPVSSSRNKAGQLSPLVSGSIARNRSAMTGLPDSYLLLLALNSESGLSFPSRQGLIHLPKRTAKTARCSNRHHGAMTIRPPSGVPLPELVVTANRVLTEEAQALRAALEEFSNALQPGSPWLRDDIAACSHSGRMPVPDVQARPGRRSSRERSRPAPEYAVARTTTGARLAGSAKTTAGAGRSRRAGALRSAGLADGITAITRPPDPQELPRPSVRPRATSTN
jgi:hypothetical protein